MTDDLFDVVDEDSTGDPQPAKVRLRVHVRPGSGKSGVVGRYGNALHVRVAAPPVAGRANEAVVKLLADELGVDGSKIVLSSGEKSADKRFVLEVGDLGELRRRLHDLVDGTGGGGATSGARSTRSRHR